MLCYVMLCYVSIENNSGVQSDKENHRLHVAHLAGPSAGLSLQRHNMVKGIGLFELNQYNIYEQCHEIMCSLFSVVVIH